jgi:hypothetical protein
MVLAVAISIAAAAAGCAMNRGSACDGWSPIIVSSQDWSGLSDDAKLKLTKHNEHGENVCGWRPPN